MKLFKITIRWPIFSVNTVLLIQGLSNYEVNKSTLNRNHTITKYTLSEGISFSSSQTIASGIELLQQTEINPCLCK
jgi:hypothetical protein